MLLEYGVVITPEAAHYDNVDLIRNYLKSEQLNGKQLNASFHKSWHKIANSSDWQLKLEQLVHYITTYGYEQAGIYDQDSIFIPEEVLNLPEPIALKVITCLSEKQLITKCLDLLASGVALKQETIDDIFSVLDDCGYSFKGNEVIKNKEAKCVVIDRTGILPSNGDELFRYLFYKATGKSLIIKNASTISAIKQSGYQLPALTLQQQQELAKSFNRYKPLWLALKAAYKDNRRVINQISKWSKTKHVPMPVNPINVLTSQFIERSVLEPALSKANIYQLVRAGNACLEYAMLKPEHYYRIRNGKGYAKNKDNSLEKNELLRNFSFVYSEMLSRINKELKVFIPKHIQYAVPVSEKMFSGNIPKGTKVSVPYGEEHILVGIYWEGDRVDLDLSGMQSDGEKVGWDGRYSDSGVMYSGDITSAPNGASEWLYLNKVDKKIIVTVNSFRAEDQQPYKIIVGYGSNIKANYVINPNKVVFSADAVMSQKEQIVGIIQPTDTGIEFILVDQGIGDSNVSATTAEGIIAREAIINQANTTMTVNQLFTVVDSKEEADLDLSPECLNRTTILDLFT